MKTWIDPATGLEWLIETKSGLDWYAAKGYAESLGGFRLPTRAELSTLIDDSKYKPAHSSPVGISTRNFWTSSPFVGGAVLIESSLGTLVCRGLYHKYWFISFGTGYTGHKSIGAKLSVCLVKE